MERTIFSMHSKIDAQQRILLIPVGCCSKSAPSSPCTAKSMRSSASYYELSIAPVSWCTSRTANCFSIH
jgi:hypothetical protein